MLLLLLLQTGETPLMKACLNLHVDVINLLLKYSPDLELISLEGRTVITMAVVRGSLDIVKLLLEGSHQTADIHCTRVCDNVIIHVVVLHT